MAFTTRKKFANVAVSSALTLGAVPNRLMGVEVFFPDIGSPVAVSLGFLRYSWEPSPDGEGKDATEPPPNPDHLKGR